MGAQISLWGVDLFSFGYIPGRGVAESHSNSTFNFLGESPYCFDNGCANLYSHQQCTKVFFSSNPQQYLSLVFLIIKNHSDGHEVIVHYDFDLLAWWLVILSTFSYTCWPFLCIFFCEKMSLQVLCRFLSFEFFKNVELCEFLVYFWY